MRRALGAALGSVLLSVAIVPSSTAGTRCESGVCTAGIPTARVKEIAATQQMNEWCWAASISMAFAYHGHPVSQSEIVRTIWGQVVNLPAMNGMTITGALNREWTDSNGKRFRSRSSFTDLAAGVAMVDNQRIVSELKAERPLIVGVKGHAMLLTAISYMPMGANVIGPVVGAVVRDPWPYVAGQGVRRDLQRDEMRPIYVATVAVEDVDDGVNPPPPSTTVETPQRPRTHTIRVACTHAAHPNGDLFTCTHRAHQLGDLAPCQHACPYGMGFVPCHPNGDVFPCTHPAHALGDAMPCTHPLHPEGDERVVSDDEP
jgi:hypothetical protein